MAEGDGHCIVIESAGPLRDHNYFKNAALGFHGKNVKGIEKKTHCRINIFSLDVGKWKIKIVGGAESAMKEAETGICELMEDLSVDMIEDNIFSWRGIQKKIESLSKQTGAFTQLGFGAIAVAGMSSQVEGMRAAVQNLMETAIVLSLPFTVSKAGLLIGKGGANIKAIRVHYDVYVNVDSEAGVLHMIAFDETSLNEAVAFLEKTIPRTLIRMVQVLVPLDLTEVPMEKIQHVLDGFPVTLGTRTASGIELQGATRFIVQQAMARLRQGFGDAVEAPKHSPAKHGVIAEGGEEDKKSEKKSEGAAVPSDDAK